MKLLFLMVVILLVLQSLLPKMSNGDVIITCLIFIFMMTHMGTLVLPSVVLMAVFHSFVYPTIYHLTSSDIVILTTYVRHLMPVKIYVHLSVRVQQETCLYCFGFIPTYACVGPQVSRNSPKVHNHPTFMNKLPNHHWESLLWLMRRAEESFKSIADHKVISHIHHAKTAVPFKTFATTNHKSNSAKFFGGIAFGNNVFL